MSENDRPSTGGAGHGTLRDDGDGARVGRRTATRSQAQRERILEAARVRFVEHGFHAATMADIAETAGMSPGLIYRYFRGKDEIILAIIERQLALVRADIAQVDTRQDLPSRVAESYGAESHGLSAALYLEMSAEASRNPQIAAAVAAFDATLRADLVEWLVRSPDSGGCGMSREQAARRVLMLQCLFEGLRVREVREPGLDRELLAAALRDVLPGMLRTG